MQRGVILREYDDDGALVTVEVAASSTAALLAYANTLESSLGFDRVRLRSLSRVGESTAPSSSAPQGIPGLSDLSGLLGADFSGIGDIGAPPAPPNQEVQAVSRAGQFLCALNPPEQETLGTTADAAD